MDPGLVARLASVVVVIGAVAPGVLRIPRHDRLARALGAVLLLIAAAHVALVVWLIADHLRFPLHLDLTEGVIQQHFWRAMRGQAIYPAPTPEYVPLAYNPLYYVIAVPFGWLLGDSLATLRLVSVLGILVSAAVLYRTVWEETRSAWWAWVTVGLFAAAYRVMDAYLDTAHSDSWLLASALLGTYLLERARTGASRLAGMALLVAAFWFKQHGALFAIGGLLFITWRDGLRRAWPSWALSALLGPAAYLVAGPSLFGPYFHYFTYEVPRGWTELNLLTVRRFVGFVVKSYPILAVASGAGAVHTILQRPRRVSIWQVQGAMAVLAGFMGALDPGSSNNVFIPMGAWFILLGALALHRWTARPDDARRYGLHLVALAISFALLAYNPLSVATARQAPGAYDDLVGMVQSLGGTTYAPTLGQLPDTVTLYPAAHWVALEDMIRGPGRDTRNHPTTRRLLDPALHPQGPAYILANHPLDASYPWIEFLLESYVLEDDLGERFIALQGLPKRFAHGWPRYLYRYEPGSPPAPPVVP